MVLKLATTPRHVRQVRKLARSVELQPSVRQRRPAPGSPALISVIRNELPRLAAFLAHYRSLGVRNFLFLDNNSVDGSTDFLAAQDDCSVFPAREPFSWQQKQAWIQTLIQLHDPAGWYLVVDADEKLVFDQCEQRTIDDLVEWLERHDLKRARALLIDLYPRGPLLAANGSDPEDPHCWFDTAGYIDRRKRHMPSVTGGPRYRAFQSAGRPLDPELTKFPLFRAAPGDIMSNPHHHYPFADNFPSPRLLGLLHEKFDKDFAQRVAVAVSEGQYWNGSAEYRAYAAALEANPSLTLWNDNSRAYENSADLVTSGLIEPVNWPD
jgi:hypothetical protein